MYIEQIDFRNTYDTGSEIKFFKEKAIIVVGEKYRVESGLVRGVVYN